MSKKPSVILIGAGNMGGSLLRGWTHAGSIDFPNSAVVDPNPSDDLVMNCEQRRIKLNPYEDIDGYDFCVVAVKPHMFGDVLPGLYWPQMSKTAFVSIAAGVAIDNISAMVKENAPEAPVVRTMPNLPTAFGQGITLMAAGANVGYELKSTISALFSAVGEAMWCDSEDQLDRLMGISACGPAYIFHMCEALEAAAIEQGATPKDAATLARMTVRGAAAQLAEDDRTATALREAVTSPGGTTEAALNILRNDTDGLEPLMQKAVGAAYARAKDLAS